MPFLEVKVPTLIRGTNRWGECVFHYMRMLVDRCPHMRMQLIAAWVQCQRSSYDDEDPEGSVRRFFEVMLGKLLH